MKTKLTILLAALVSFNVQAADELTTALQQGLFKEEADHDLAAAIKAYQFVVAGADAQRKLAATAVFRLGECYRKLGQTNEAVAQYQRIVAQFTDQTNLVTLSRQNLVGLGVSKISAARPGGAGNDTTAVGFLEARLAANLSDAAQASALVQQLQALNRSELRRVLPTVAPDQLLNRLLEDLAQTVARATEQSVNLAPDHPQLKEKRDKIAALHTQIDERIDGIQEGLKVKAEVLKRQVEDLKRELANLPAPRVASGTATGVLHESAATDEEEKEIRRIQSLIKDSPDLVNAKNVHLGVYGDNPRYGTPLHKAAMDGQLVVARFLIDNGADLDSRDAYGRTPLHQAALKGHKSMAELLLAKGADPNAAISPSANSGSGGFTPLHLAAQNGYRNVCEALLAGKADLNARDINGITPLHLASDRSYSSVTELLLTRGANADARTSNGNTPLHSAASSGAKRVAELLLTNKADLNAQNAQGGTPLHSAVSGQRADMVRLLLANKANPNLAFNEKSGNMAGWTPLAVAVYQDDNVPMVRLLLENGANPNVVTSRSGWTLLMQAVQKGSLELAEALVAAGAEVNARIDSDSRGTALYFATSINSTNAAALVELLLKNKADVNVTDAYGSTPLIQAVSKRNPEVVKLLVEHGADVNAMTQQGDSPLSLIKPQRQQGSVGIPAPQPLPAPGIPGARNIRTPGGIGGAGQPTQPPVDPNGEIIALLEQRGARDDLRRLSALSTSRNQEDRRGWFFKGTNDWNHFTLLELIALVNPRRDINSSQTPYLAFPDLTRIAISRIDPKTAKTEDIRLDLATTLANGDCAKDVPLQWGDVVDIPEQDHFVNATWDRFSDIYYNALQKCLERTVRVTVKGQSTNVVLTPFRESKGSARMPGGANPYEPRMASFRLNSFLRTSGLLLSSSDVTRVKVKRTDPATKQVRERVFDLNQIQYQTQRGDDMNDLWLRDGDVIEVPEKDANRAAASPRAGASSGTFSVQLNFEPIDANAFIQAEPIQFQFTPLPSKE